MDPNQQYNPNLTPDYQMQAPAPPNPAKRILLYVVIGIGVLSVLLLIFVLFFTSPSSMNDVGKIKSSYIEIARMAELATDSDRAPRETKNIAATLKSSSLSNQNDIDTFAASNYRGGFSKDSLSYATDESYDGILEEAGRQNIYDEQFNKIIEQLLEDAEQHITNALAAQSDNSTLTSMLNSFSEGNQIMLSVVSE